MKQKKVVIRQKFPLFQGVQHKGDTFDELLNNIYEAVEGCLAVDM